MILLLWVGGLMATVGFVLVMVNVGRTDAGESEAHELGWEGAVVESHGGEGAFDIFQLEIAQDSDPLPSLAFFEPEPLFPASDRSEAKPSPGEPSQLSLPQFSPASESPTALDLWVGDLLSVPGNERKS